MTTNITDIKNLQNYMVEVIKKTDFLPLQDKEWLESIVFRNDNQIGYDQLMLTIRTLEDYNKKNGNGELSLIERYLVQKDIEGKIWSSKIMYYKQSHIMIAVAQRKKHPKVDVPNLYGLLAPQTIRVSMQTCYGKGYEDARNYFVQLALDNPGITHILYVDDDVLLPLDAITRLLNYHLPIVSGVYTKRNPLLESTVTTPRAHPKYVLSNSFVEPVQGDYTPVAVGCIGLGITLIDVDVFRRLQGPWFKFIHETNADGSKGRVVVGEDSRFIQYASQNNLKTYVVPGICGIHTDMKTGKQYGPSWLVDEKTRKLKPEFEEFYTKFACPPQECYSEDVDDVFKNSKPM